MKKIIVLIVCAVCIFNSCKKSSLRTEEKIIPRDFLSDKKYEKLVVDVVYEKGYSLNSQTINNLQTFLSNRLHKPKGIIFTQKEISNQGKDIISISDITNLEKQFRTEFSGRSTLAVFIFVSGSDYAENSGNSKVLGVAYGNTSIALFGKTINSYSGGLTQPSKVVLETTVADHEFGHLLGLVDNGTNMVEYHRDDSNGRHCDKKNCLMYYATETSDIVSNLLGGEIPALENYCIRDLQFNGGK